MRKMVNNETDTAAHISELYKTSSSNNRRPFGSPALGKKTTISHERVSTISRWAIQTTSAV